MRAGCTGPLSNRLFAAALTTGKRVRTETSIGASRVSIPSVAVDLALSVLGGLERPPRRRARRRRDERADRARARRPGRRHDLRRQPPRRPRAQPRAALRRHRGRTRRACPSSCSRADIVLSSTSSPHPIVGRDELELVMRERAAASAAADRHRRAARHRGGVRRADGRQPVRHRRPAGGRRAQPRARARARRRARRRSSRRRSTASPAGWASSRRCRRSSALREHGNDLVEQVLAENAGRWESASPRDLARIEAIARAVMSRLLHEPTIRLRSLSEERGHASLELVRELFGLREDAPRRRSARRRSWRRSTSLAPPPRALMRIGTRASALALAQARARRRSIAGRPARPCRDRPDRHSRRSRVGRRKAHRKPARTSRAGSQSSSVRCCAARSTSRCTPPRTSPASRVDGLALVAAPPRAGAEDALCGAPSLEALAPGARVGTSSVRRVAQLLAAREDLEPVAIRGNVDTRLAKLEQRRARRDRARPRRPAAAGARGCDRRRARPGALRSGSRSGDARAAGAQRRCGRRRRRSRRSADAHALACLLAERALARALERQLRHAAGRARDGERAARLRLRAWVGLPDGSAWVSDELRRRPRARQARSARTSARGCGTRAPRRSCAARTRSRPQRWSRRGDAGARCAHERARLPRRRRARRPRTADGAGAGADRARRRDPL